MLNCTVTERLGTKWLRLEGRIDSLTSPELQRQVNALILAGAHVLVLDFEQASYISSAGMRILMAAHKQLVKVGGRLIIHRPCPNVRAVFDLSGTTSSFEIVESCEEINANGQAAQSVNTVQGRWNHIAYECQSRDAARGTVVPIGSQVPLPMASYVEADVVPVKASALRFATGLATMGESYGEYKHLFGEALVMDHSLYFYPAVKHPSVDFLLGADHDPDLEYKFLYGFAFSGAYRYVLSFEGVDGPATLAELVSCAFSVSSAAALGVVLLAESRGILGMHLKRVPIAENKPAGGKSIFDRSVFSDWMSFPIEPQDAGELVAGAGLAARDREHASPQLRDLVGEGANFHLHGGVFRREPVSKEPERFEGELRRVLNELEISKVQHLLGGSRLGRGLVGIVELEG